MKTFIVDLDFDAGDTFNNQHLQLTTMLQTIVLCLASFLTGAVLGPLLMRWYFQRKMNNIAGNFLQQGGLADLNLEEEMDFEEGEEETGAEVID